MAHVALKKPNLKPLAGRVAETTFHILQNLADIGGNGPLSRQEIEALEINLNQLVLMERASNVLEAVINPDGRKGED